MHEPPTSVVLEASYRSDVAPGEGALYLTPNGWAAVVINGGNAAKATGVTTGMWW